LSPVVWLDAADTSTITESSGSVSQWNDKSGNGYNVTQGTGLNQPTTGSATINGLNVLTFDGSNDRMLNSAVPSSSRPHSYVAVVKETAGQTATKSILNAEGFTTLQEMAIFFRTVSSIRRFEAFANGGFTSSIALTTTNTNIVYLKLDGANSEIGFNNQSVAMNIAGTTRRAGLYVGSNSAGTGENFNGQIAEVFYFNSALTENQKRVLFAYLASKWAVQF
jgi:hypothetical protein